jgi:16S rRNA (cytidine1402-2'-O)-methyltransferase
MSNLFVVATPIGNLEDITLRALRILREVRLVLAEDTRSARILLTKHGIRATLLSYNEHNHKRRLPEILQRLEGGEDIALISDAGTPAISDPGTELAAAVRAAGHNVVPIPGASAPVAALSAAGLRSVSFCFAGFLPRTAGKLRSLLQAQKPRPETLVAFESPERLRTTLTLLSEVMPERRIAVCRELTKLHEEFFVGSPAEALERFTEPRGEVVLIVEGASEAPPTATVSGPGAAAEASEMRRLGLTRQQASALLTARHGINRRTAYELWLAAKREA